MKSKDTPRTVNVISSHYFSAFVSCYIDSTKQIPVIKLPIATYFITPKKRVNAVDFIITCECL